MKNKQQNKIKNNVKDKTQISFLQFYPGLNNLIQTAGNLSFNQPLGTIVNHTDGLAFPGIMKIRILNTIGNTSSSAAPINVATRELYQFIRHANSGHVNYEAPDLMLYLLSISSIVSLIAHMKRILALTNSYALENRYLPKDIIHSMGINYDDLISNKPRYITLLNLLVDKMRAFALPSDYAFLATSGMLYSNIFKESPLNKSALFYFIPENYYEYKGYVDTKGGMLLNVRISETLKGIVNFSRYLDTVSDLLDKLLNDEDFGIMAGDILKAYGSEQLVTYTPFDESLQIYPVYQASINDAVRNATINVHAEASAITQSDNAIYQTVRDELGVNGANASSVIETKIRSIMDRALIDSVEDIITPEQLFNKTMFVNLPQKITLHGKPSDDLENEIDYQEFLYTNPSLYMIKGISLFFKKRASDQLLQLDVQQTYQKDYQWQYVPTNDITKFSCAPRIYQAEPMSEVIIVKTGTKTWTKKTLSIKVPVDTRFLGDVNKYGWIQQEQLDLLHYLQSYTSFSSSRLLGSSKQVTFISRNKTNVNKHTNKFNPKKTKVKVETPAKPDDSQVESK